MDVSHVSRGAPDNVVVMTEPITNTEIMELLNENYYTLGVSGAQAVSDVWSEIASGYFDAQCDEWGISMTQLVSGVNAWATWLTETNRLAKPVLLS